MIPRAFEYYAPASVSEALSLLQKYGDESKVLAGGQSLVPLMKLRLVSPAHIIDIGRIPGLSYIKEEDNKIRIGALTTHHEVETSPVVKSKCMVLSEAESHVGDQQVRNRGTIGGSACHADPAADVPSVLVALDAEFKMTGSSGDRVVDARNFFQDIFTTDLRQNEILAEITVPALPPRSGSTYLKFERGAGDFAIVAVAAAVTLDQAGVCQDVRLGLAGVESIPLRALKAEEALKGKKPDDNAILEAAARASEQSKPSSDIRGSAEYKKEMVKVFVKRALKTALSRVS
ncbi:MAG: xanthine dehydrogenase family protein subunit M [Thaumarchaeota archaeon]|nr:xanthine dehydrogenase family protein subunit M [Nitrososphaerota archaeon]